MRLFDFPDRPGTVTTVPELWRAVLDLIYQLGPGSKSFPITGDQSVGTAETAIRHGHRGAPSGVSFVPRADCRWWSPRAPDATYVYLQASAAVTGEVRVWP